VNITKLEAADSTGDALTGGYIIKVDKLDGAETQGFYSIYPPFAGSARKILYQYHYPKQEDITSHQKAYIRAFIFSFETAMNGISATDSVNGYSKFLDVPSVIDYLLINEMTKNVDAYRLSCYMYKDRDSKNGKLFFGPVWDFNAGFGNCDYYDASKIAGWQFTYLTTNTTYLNTDEWQVPFWWKKIFQDSLFQVQLKNRWIELRKNQFTISKINAWIDSTALVLNESQQRNFERWPILNSYVWPNAYVGGTYSNEIAYLKKWIKDRFNWMDTELTGAPVAVLDKSEAPSKYELRQNYPNPFNPSTAIQFSIPCRQFVTMKIYDILGKEIMMLVNEEYESGEHTIQFSTEKLSSGAYFYQMTAGNYTSIKKLLVIK
jgi:hypothetical protein